MGKRLTQEQKEEIQTLLRDTELSQTQIAAKVNVTQATVSNYAKKYLTVVELKARTSNSFSQERNSRWKGEENSFVDNRGYRSVRTPEWWEGYKRNSSYAYEHQLVYAEANGLTCIPDGYCIHHINCERLDNRIENLVMLTHSEHAALHNALRR